MDDLLTQAPAPREEARPAKRPMWARVVRAVGWTSIVLGLLILGFVAQQLFVTTWLAERNQEQLTAEAEERFATAEIEVVAYDPIQQSIVSGDDPGTVVDGSVGAEVDPNAPQLPTTRSLLVEAPPEAHQPFAIIRIPKIERLAEGWTVVEGVTLRDLKNGAGHMADTPLPGQPGNAVISGHRTTYGAPFHELDILDPGDRIEVETATGVHVYEVRESIVVQPTDIWVTGQREGAWLTLTTCHPRFRSIQRLVVFAELVDGPNFRVIYP